MKTQDSLIQLIYISIPTLDVHKATSDFVPAASEMNARNDITGMIISGNRFYLQVLEGCRLPINQLYQNILRDDRHRSPILLRYNQIKSRGFGSWSMLHTTEDELNADYLASRAIPELSSDEAISKFTGIQALTLFRRLSAIVSATSLDT